jgi:NAD(P)-dependent dehydrogenase (short-subunit alcohol dehydrogenase family)
MNIAGKRVLITGGSSGIGYSLAQILLAKHAKVAISGRRPEIVAEAVRSLQTEGAEVHGIAADVTTAEGRAATLEQALATLGGLDVLVNNAGGVRKGEGIHVLTVYPGGTDTPMMKSNRAGPDLGFSRESTAAVAEAIATGIETGAFEVIRGGETRAQMIALNREDPAAVDERFLGLKPALEEAVKDHSAL